MKVHFREQYGSKGEEFLYVTPENQNNVVRVTIKGEKPSRRSLFNLKRLFQRVFLPHGYPDSVAEDYIDYQKWDTLQAFCSTITGTLATHAILKGIGVGSDTATALSATVTWVLKEGTGHFGRICFAYWKGTELDIDSKKWRLRADLLNDLALATEVFLLPYYPEYSTFILCATSTMKALVGVTGGATRSALTQHHAIRGNLADVSSKDSAQETCVNLIASFVGLFMLTGIKSHMWLTVLFVVMTALHLLANYRAVKAICLRTFNEARFLIALEEFLKTGEVLTPRQVNRLESVTVGQTVYLTAKVKMGVTANTLLEKYQNSYDLESIIALFDTRDKFLVAETRKYLGVYLYCDARPHDILKAYFFAASYLQDKSQLIDRYWDIHNRWNEFANLARNRGWSTLSHLLPVDEYRLDWRI